MRYVTLVATSDEFDDTPGLILKGTPKFDDLTADREGGLIAHDLLEHQNGTAHMGPVWDELEALGGIWYVRGRHGSMFPKRHRHEYFTPAQNVAADISRMFGDWDGGCGPGSMRTHASLYDEDFADIIAEARKLIAREYRDEGHGLPDEDERGWTAERHAELEAYLSLALHRLRTGFRKAAKRYGESMAGLDLFLAVREAVGALEVEYEGQEFRLAYGDGGARAYPI